MRDTRLTGVYAIRGFVGRSWGTILDWIEHKGFPARKIRTYWESDEELIREWRKEQILTTEEDPMPSKE